MAAFALGAATALIVPGTGTPNANIVENYREHAADRYIAPFEPCSTTDHCNLQGVDYPASFWPLFFIGNWCPGLSCDKWDVSVGKGVQSLDSDLRDLLDNTSQDIVIFGYSQGGAVVSNELRNLGDLTPDQLKRLSVVMIGNAFNPDGGFFTRLGFLGHVPLIDVTFGLATPVDTGVPMTAIGFEYDPVMYAPLYWGNPFTVLNALAAFDNVHGFYLTPNGNGPTDPIAYGYTEAELAEQLDRTKHPENFREDSEGNVYVMIPAKSLPIMNLVTSLLPSSLQPVAKPVVDLVSPVLKVVIDLGYDWSGDPGVPRTLSPLPFNPNQNWPAVGVKLVAATVQGIQAFIGDLGGLTTTIAPSTPAPLSDTTTVSTLAAPEPTTPVDSPPAGTLKLVRDNTTAVQNIDDIVGDKSSTGDTTTEARNEAPPSTPNEPPVAKPEETKPDETSKPQDDEGRKKGAHEKADKKGAHEKADKKGAHEKAGDAQKADAKKPDVDRKPDNGKKAGSETGGADQKAAA